MKTVDIRKWLVGINMNKILRVVIALVDTSQFATGFSSIISVPS